MNSELADCVATFEETESFKWKCLAIFKNFKLNLSAIYSTDEIMQLTIIIMN